MMLLLLLPHADHGYCYHHHYRHYEDEDDDAVVDVGLLVESMDSFLHH